MESLRFECDLDENSELQVSKRVLGDGVMICCKESGFDCDVALNKQQAAKLRDWLNEFLKEGE